jgi:hypothetical protein
LIDGAVKSSFRQKPKPNLDLELIMSQRDSSGYYGGNMLTGFCRSNAEGRFEFPLEEPLSGTWETIIQAKDKGKQKDNRVMLDRFSPIPIAYPVVATEFIFPESDSGIVLEQPEQQEVVSDDSLSMTEKTHLLKELKVTAKRQNRKREEQLSSSLIVYDVNQQQEKLFDKGDEQYDRVIDFLQATNPAFRINPSRRSLSGETTDDPQSDRGYYYYNSLPVMFLLDNKPLIDQAWKTVDNVSLSTIERIVVTTQAAGQPATIYDEEGEYSDQVMVDVTYLETKSGQLPLSEYFDRTGKIRSDLVYIFLHSRYGQKSVKPSDGVRNTFFEGYTVSKEFYSPKYEYQPEVDDVDYRRTLYWNPTVSTDSSGKASVGFYNNSSATGFSIQAETVTKDGKVGVLEK